MHTTAAIKIPNGNFLGCFPLKYFKKSANDPSITMPATMEINDTHIFPCGAT